MKITAQKWALAVIAFLIASGFMFHSTTAFAAQKKSSHHVVVKKTSHKKVKKKIVRPKHVSKVKSSRKAVRKPVRKVSRPVRISVRKGPNAIALAQKFLGTPYVYGAAGPGGFDCSGLSLYVYKALGVSLPHSARAQSQLGQSVGKGSLKPGDLVFFTTDGSGKVSHVGIYVGSNKFIHAPSTGEKVSIASLNERYYSKRFVAARRLI